MHCINKLNQCLLSILLLILISCNSDNTNSNLTDLDLMAHGLPVKIKAPEDAEIVASDLGFVKDVTVKGKGNFYLQITAGMATTTDSRKIKEEHLNDVKNHEFLMKYYQEEDQGFIFRKKISEDLVNHDFRFVKIQGIRNISIR